MKYRTFRTASGRKWRAQMKPAEVRENRIKWAVISSTVLFGVNAFWWTWVVFG